MPRTTAVPDMEINQASDEELLRGLREHAKFRDRNAALLAVASGAVGNLRRADEAQERLVHEIRRAL